MIKRLALALALMFTLASGLVAVLPSSPNGVHCGSLVNPDYTTDETDQLLNQAANADALGNQISQDSGGMFGSDLADSAGDSAIQIQAAFQACEDARSSRRTVLYILVGLAALVPVAIMFVAGRRDQPSA